MGLGWHLIYEMENKSHVPNHQPVTKYRHLRCPTIFEADERRRFSPWHVSSSMDIRVLKLGGASKLSRPWYIEHGDVEQHPEHVHIIGLSRNIYSTYHIWSYMYMSLCVPIFNGEYYERKHGFCWGVQRVFNLSHLEPQNKATNSPGGSMDHIFGWMISHGWNLLEPLCNPGWSFVGSRFSKTLGSIHV